jgi:hypothetical protein
MTMKVVVLAVRSCSISGTKRVSWSGLDKKGDHKSGGIGCEILAASAAQEQ